MFSRGWQFLTVRFTLEDTWKLVNTLECVWLTFSSGAACLRVSPGNRPAAAGACCYLPACRWQNNVTIYTCDWRKSQTSSHCI